MIPHDEIEAFVRVFAGSPRLAEIELKMEGETTLRLRRSLSAAEKPIRKPKPVAVPAPAAVLTTPSLNTTEPVAAPSGTIVTSTLVGVFRGATREPVTVGSNVRAGQILGFIEVMRLSNDVTAPEAGTIAAIRVQDGQPVEYGQPLFEIVPPVAVTEE